MTNYKRRGFLHGCRESLTEIYDGVEALLTNLAGLPPHAENLALQRQILEGVTDLQQYISDIEEQEETLDEAPYGSWNHLLRHELVQHTSARRAASTTTPPPHEDQMPSRHTCDGHCGQHAPLTLLSPPQTWQPALHDVLLVTRIWRDMIWVWNESATDSHHGVGIILMRWLIGDYPHWMPAAQKHCIITGHFQDQEESGLPVIQIHAILPSGWPWGRGLLMVRWLEGW